MKSLKILSNLADKFERKLALGQVSVSQTGTTELFFGSESNMMKFGEVLRSPKSTVFKVLNDCYNRSGKTCSFDLKINAEPGKGAAWVLTVEPANIKSMVMSALDSEFRKIMNKSMSEQLQAAVNGAKAGGGSGSLDVGSLSLSAD
jgi:hypothetical protein